MADNVNLNPGTGGDVIAADELESPLRKYQRINALAFEDVFMLKGKRFVVSHHKAANTSHQYTWKVPSGLLPFIRIAASHGTAGYLLELLEAPTWTTATGTRITIYNMDRSSGTTSTIQDDQGGSFTDNNSVALDQTGLTGGTLIYRFQASESLAKGYLFDDHPRIRLAQNTQYALRLTAASAISYMAVEFLEP